MHGGARSTERGLGRDCVRLRDQFRRKVWPSAGHGARITERGTFGGESGRRGAACLTF